MIKLEGTIFLLICVVLVQSQTETLLNRIFAGYQGWFTAAEDGSNNGWTHFKMHSQKPFSRTNCVIDFWPQTSEYQKKYQISQFGSNYNLFSPYDYSTVRTHFRWMQQSDIHGVFLQRFGSDIKNRGSNMWKFKNKVFQNIMNATKQTNRLWCLMYDLSGLNAGEIRSVIMEDFKYLRNTYLFTNSPFYIKHKGKPLVAIWGVGFNDNRKYTLLECAQLLDFLKNGQYGGHSVMFGVPRYWRQGGRDSVTGSDLELLHNILQRGDVVSPWTVGRYSTLDQARNDARVIVKADLAWCNINNVTLLPVIFPGFSWHNLQASGENPDHPGPYDQIPRKQNGTYFFQEQGIQIAKTGVKVIYVAMFDQMNQGTAIFKCSKTPPSLPDGLKFVQYKESPDFYLKLTGSIGKMLK